MSIGKSIYSKEHEYLIARLKEARERANLTQKQVADKIGVTQSFVSKIESGQYRIDAIQLSQFAKLFNKKITFFVK